MNYKKISLYVFTAALLGVSPAAVAQGISLGRTSDLQKANKLYNNNEYALALEQYMQVVGSAEPDLKTAQRIADSYRQLQRTPEAETWYAKVVAMPDRAPINLYHYAEMLRSKGKYEEAKAQYEKWATEQPDMAARAKAMANSADFALKASKKQATATVQALQQLNTDRASDFAPRAFDGGIIFTSDRGTGTETAVYGLTGRPYLQLYTAQQSGSESWSSPVPVQDLAGAGSHHATASVAKDNQVVYFTRSSNMGGDAVNADPTSWPKPLKGNTASNNLEIFSAERAGGRWSNMKPFAYNKVEEYSVGHPAVSADGNTMYFVSDMPGGQGDTDIYFTTRQGDGSWSAPVNAGTVINTAGKESYPFVDESGVLYFSSNGHAGMGGLDIFTAKGKHAAWTAVTNMGQPVNSSKNDFGIMFTEAGKKGLFSSNRNSNNGTDDIFGFSLLARPVVVAINTTDNSGAATGDVAMKLSRKGTNEPVSATTDTKGVYYLNARVGDEFEIRSTKAGFQDNLKTLAIAETAADTLRLPVVMNEADAVVLIKTQERNATAVGDVNITVTKKGSAEVVTTKSDAEGEIILSGRAGDTFVVRGTKEGYLNQSLEVVIPRSTRDTLNIAMHFDSNEEEKPIVMENVYYNTGKWNIRKDAARELDKLVTLLNENPEIRIEIGSHTDSRQHWKKNQILSDKRAKSVVNYLVSRGIERNRLESKGYGESILLNKCSNNVKCSPAEHQLNRRTEFKIIKK